MMMMIEIMIIMNDNRQPSSNELDTLSARLGGWFGLIWLESRSLSVSLSLFLTRKRLKMNQDNLQSRY